jgi:hypothetical protein
MPPQPLQRLADGVDHEFGFRAHAVLLRRWKFLPQCSRSSAPGKRLPGQAQLAGNGIDVGEEPDVG